MKTNDSMDVDEEHEQPSNNSKRRRSIAELDSEVRSIWARISPDKLTAKYKGGGHHSRDYGISFKFSLFCFVLLCLRVMVGNSTFHIFEKLFKNFRLVHPFDFN